MPKPPLGHSFLGEIWWIFRRLIFLADLGARKKTMPRPASLIATWKDRMRHFAGAEQALDAFLDSLEGSSSRAGTLTSVKSLQVNAKMDCEVNRTHRHTLYRDMRHHRCECRRMLINIKKFRRACGNAGLSMAILVGLLIFRRYAVRSR